MPRPTDLVRATPEPMTTTANKRYLATKVPEIAGAFWVLKLLTTGMGEAMSDAMGQKSVPIAAAIGIFGLWFALWLQLRQREYRAPYYWFAVMMVAIFGTMAADGIHDGAGDPLHGHDAAVCADHRPDLPVLVPQRGHAVDPQRRHQAPREVLLGRRPRHVRARHGRRRPHRAAAELGLLAVGAPVRRDLRDPGDRLVALQLEPDLRLLVRYVVTRPLGASFADGFSKPTNGGLNLGDPTVSLIAFAVFAALVAWITITKRDVQGARAAEPAGATHRHATPHPHPVLAPEAD